MCAWVYMHGCIIPSWSRPIDSPIYSSKCGYRCCYCCSPNCFGSKMNVYALHQNDSPHLAYPFLTCQMSRHLALTVLRIQRINPWIDPLIRPEEDCWMNGEYETQTPVGHTVLPRARGPDLRMSWKTNWETWGQKMPRQCVVVRVHMNTHLDILDKIVWPYHVSDHLWNPSATRVDHDITYEDIHQILFVQIYDASLPIHDWWWCNVHESNHTTTLLIVTILRSLIQTVPNDPKWCPKLS